MLPQQKEAMSALGAAAVFTALVLAGRVLFAACATELVFGSLAAFVAVLWIMRVLVGMKPKVLDERDRAIRYQAGLIASHAFGLVVMVGAIVLYAVHRVAVPAEQVALLAYTGWMAMYLVWAGTILVLYRGGR